jgi:hypothetical protein
LSWFGTDFDIVGVFDVNTDTLKFGFDGCNDVTMITGMALLVPDTVVLLYLLLTVM